MKRTSHHRRRALNMDTLLRDGCDPCDEDFQSLVMD